MTQQESKKKLKRLCIALLVSVICLVGIFIYALNWERISQINWKEKWQQVVAKMEVVKEFIAPEPEPLVVSYKSIKMSNAMPVLTKTAEGVELVKVPLMNQKDCGYRTGCELVSGTMVLNYYGKESTPQDLYEVIEKVPRPVDATGIGVNPQQFFIGDPQTSYGYGCYAEPLMKAMNQLLGDDWYAVNISGTDLAAIEKGYLEQGTPVIMWATIHMMEPAEGSRWTLADGTEFQWIAGEHCLVLVGADEQYYYFNDPDHAGEVIGYERSLVEQRYNQLGRQAIIVSR